MHVNTYIPAVERPRISTNPLHSELSNDSDVIFLSWFISEGDRSYSKQAPLSPLASLGTLSATHYDRISHILRADAPGFGSPE